MLFQIKLFLSILIRGVNGAVISGCVCMLYTHPARRLKRRDVKRQLRRICHNNTLVSQPPCLLQVNFWDNWNLLMMVVLVLKFFFSYLPAHACARFPNTVNLGLTLKSSQLQLNFGTCWKCNFILSSSDNPSVLWSLRACPCVPVKVSSVSGHPLV